MFTIIPRVNRQPLLPTFLCLYFFLFFSSSIFSQSPAGVSNNLRAWYKGEDVPTILNNTSNWPSAIPITTDAIYRPGPPNSGVVPYYTIENAPATTNGEPYIIMNDEYFETSLDINDLAFRNLTVFTVYKPNAIGDIPIWGNGEASLLLSNRARQVSTHNLTTNYNSANPTSYNHTAATRSQADSAYIHYVNYQEGASSVVAVNGRTSISTSPTTTIESNTNNYHSNLLFGNKRIANYTDANISLAEFIVYTGTLTSNEIARINSYLAIKYGIPIIQNYVLADGTTLAWDYNHLALGNSYNNNLVGIAYDNDPNLGNGNLLKSESTSQRIGDYLSLFAPAGTGVGQYYEGTTRRSLVAGHNNGNITGTTGFTVSSKFYDTGTRINRVWRVEQNGGYANYTLSFDDNITGLLPTGFLPGNMVVVVADNPNFTGTVQTYPLEYVNNTHRVQGIHFGTTTQSTKYFTIATLETALWVKADAANNVPMGSGLVTTLKDQSLSGNDLEGVFMSPSTAAPLLQVPTGTNAEMNFNPYVMLNQGSQRNYLRKAGFLGFGRAESSVFMVVRNDGTGGTGQCLLSYATVDNSGTTRLNGDDLTIRNPQSIAVRIASNSGIASTTNIANNLPALISNQHGANTNNLLHINGRLTSQSNYASNSIINEFGTLIIGQEQDIMNDPSSYQPTQQLEGDFAELIISKRITATKADRIRTYLAIKYGISLEHDYQDASGSIVWTINASRDYNSRIAGIGREDAFELDQRKSRSQTPDAKVTIGHTGSFTNNQDFLLWGSTAYRYGSTTIVADYDSITSLDAPTGHLISQRYWKVANPNNGVGQVRVSFDIPNNVTLPLADARMLISSSPSFSTGFLTAIQPTSVSATQLHFDVTLQDGQYFSLGFVQPISPPNTNSFTNNEAGAPSTFEACAGDNVSFTYSNLSAHPVSVRLVKKGGGSVDVLNAAILFSGQSSSPSGFAGTMSFDIPALAATGNVLFLDATGSIIYNSNNFITIHNPDLFLIQGANPICADQAVPLYGFPVGGFFSSPTAGLISPNQDSLYSWAAFAGLGNTHVDTLMPTLSYNYVAQYSNGVSCPDTFTLSEPIVIRDNRLSQVNFATLSQQNAAAGNQALSLDVGLSTMVVSTTPNILCNSNPNNLITPCYPHFFSGAFVDQNNNFLSPLAGGRNLVQLEYNNGGCIGRASGFIDIQGALVIYNLPDTMCKASVARFTRDPSLVYSDTSFITSNGNTRRVITNQILRTYTSNPSYSNAITPFNLTIGQEAYNFWADSLPNGVAQVVVNMQYQNLTTLTNALNQVTIVSADTFIVRHTVNIISGFTTLSINNLKSSYCANEVGDTLFPSLYFLGSSNNNLYLLHNRAGGGYDTIYLPNNYLEPSTLYNSLVPSGVGDLTLTVAYEASYYGCPNAIPPSNRPTFTITAPLYPQFTSGSPYCQGDPPDTLLTTGLVAGASESFTGTTAINPTTGVFVPNYAGVGNNIITYTLTDSHACAYSYVGTITVNQGPVVELTLDNNNSSTFTYCYNSSRVRVRDNIISRPNGGISSTVFGVGLSGNHFYPSDIYANGDTNTVIWVEVTDNQGCFASDTAYITVGHPPVVDIDSFFNNISTPYGSNGQYLSEHTYCQSSPSFPVDGVPSYTTGMVGSTSITGTGIVFNVGRYDYDPSRVTNTDGDTVVFTYADNNGCINTDTAFVKVDPVPTVSISGLPNDTVCSNNPPILLIGSPNTPSNPGSFSGAGLSSSGLFDPFAAGTGSHRLIYSFVGISGCPNSDTIDVYVASIPNLSSSINSNTSNRYCRNAAIDTLYSNNIRQGGSYQFYGDIIIPGTDLLNPRLAPDTINPIATNVYYAYTNGNGCSDTSIIPVVINPLPIVTVDYLDPIHCANGSTTTAQMLPPGGNIVSTDTAFVLNTRNISFTPTLTDTGYTQVVYSFTDGNGCINADTATTYVKPVDIPSIVGLDTFYCNVSTVIPISGSLPGGYFTGIGVDTTATGSWFFVPSGARTGFNNIGYVIPGNNNSQPITCQAQTALSVFVSPALASNLTSPANNSLFCSTDTLARFVYDSINPFVYHHFYGDSNVIVMDTFLVVTSTSSPGSNITRTDTLYAPAFNPGAANTGTNFISYVAIDSSTGCKDSVQLTYTVNQYETPTIFNLDSSYCEKDTSITIYGSPGNSIITRDGMVLNNLNPLIPILFKANGGGLPHNPLDSSIKDTVLCYYTTGACTDTARLIVDIHPVFNVNYTTTSLTKVLCLGGDTLNLTPSHTGGVFRGTGVRPGTTFFDADLAEAGIHPIAFEYTDSVTGCFSRFIDTFSVYGVPVLDFAVQGGCQYDSITFIPNNAILNLNNLFRNEYIDSVTGVWWHFEDTVVVFDSTGKRDSIPSMVYQYNSPGVYNTKLIVANQGYCVDSQTIRIVISPRVSSYPYVQDFEQGDGNWFAESRDSSYRLLWEWGIDSTIGGTSLTNPNNNSNHLWSTQNNARYEKREQAWVYGPCFDLSSLQRPMISLDYWSDVRDSDGSVLEYQKADGSWAPLGELNRGINWFDDPFLTAQPGDQSNAPVNPIGWGTKTLGWKNGRYKLDGINSSTRLRIAFAAVDIPVNPSEFYDGFAFDNVIIKNRNRNVLLETFANIGYTDIEAASDHSYQLVHHTALNKDVILLQYQMESPNGNDMFYLDNPSLGRNRAYEYNITSAGQALIDGEGLGNASLTLDLEDIDFEQDMLEDAKFVISIDTFTHINGHFQIRATATALMDIDTAARYRIYTVVSEDSLYYPNGSGYNNPLQAVARENDQFHSNNDPNYNTAHIFDTTWVAGQSQSVTFNWNHAANGFITYRPNHFHAVVFVQDIDTKEIFQVETTRDVNGYWVGVAPVEAEEELNELQSLNLFPNPAHDYFNLKFDQALEHDYQWKLVNIQGIEVQQGTVQAGTDQVLVDGLDYPAGTYILLLYNDKVFVQRKVVLGRP